MKRLFLIFSIVFFSISTFSNSLIRVQAMYIYNFTRYVDWPDNYKSEDFVIGVLGDAEFCQELKNFTMNKKVGNQSISVVCFNSIEDIKKCHILYIPADGAVQFGNILRKVSNYSNLIVSESKALSNYGAAISFVLEDNKLSFVLNSENAAKYGLKISSTLCNMAQTCI